MLFRSFIDGEVIEQNTLAKIQGANIIYESGKTAISAIDGKYNIRAWSDLVTPNAPYFAGTFFQPKSDADRIVDKLIYNALIFCGVTYPNGQYITPLIQYYGTDITNQYNPTRHYDAGIEYVIESNNPAIKARKRGGN